MAKEIGATEREIITERIKKIKKIEDLGFLAYPEKSKKSYYNSRIREIKEELLSSHQEISVAGRITGLRGHGKLIFSDISDESGKIQAVFKADNLSSEEFKLVSLYDLGDIVEVSGSLFLTNAGELSVEVKKTKILTKAIRPFPESFYGLKDTETRYRERYLDLAINQDVKDKFYIRSKVISSIREFLVEKGFLEVDTPTLQPIAGGASAKPFVTHYNAYDRDVFLRIAPELYLKRLLVGGFEKVFEFARCFRNEGVDATHNPEFTNLEFYWAYSDYEKLMDLTEELIRHVIKSINNGKLELDIYGNKIDFSKPFKKITFKELTGGKNTDEAFKEGLMKLIEPTFVTNHPTDLIPLAKRNEENPDVVDSFQLVIGGLELLKAFSELNDPVDQRKRFEDQMKLREKGDEEAQELDEDFLKAIEYGMPPAAGWGMGIDRFVRVLTSSQTLREVLFFPFMRPELVKSTENKLAIVVLNKNAGMNEWQEMNTIAHLSASFAGRVGKEIFTTNSIETKDGKSLPLNPKHAIVIKGAGNSEELVDLLETARARKQLSYVFTREMLDSTNDKKISEITASKNENEIEFLGVLIFGERKEVEEISKAFKLIG
ncbi:MAG: amino acid--tRNA ligase-related protein [Patescibacteria group bacterium]|jgi:lysyl-tRNA synthetase class 2